MLLRQAFQIQLNTNIQKYSIAIKLFFGLSSHSSTLAWRIPGMGEPGGLPSMGSHRVGHDWGDLAAAAGTNIADNHNLKKLYFHHSYK